MYIRIDKNKTIGYDEFVQQAVKITTAKGIFNSVEENIRDYFKPYSSEGIHLIDGSTHEEHEGKVYVDSTLYKDLSSMRVAVVGHFNGTNEFFKRRKRNQLGAVAIMNILNHFLK